MIQFKAWRPERYKMRWNSYLIAKRVLANWIKIRCNIVKHNCKRGLGIFIEDSKSVMACWEKSNAYDTDASTIAEPENCLCRIRGFFISFLTNFKKLEIKITVKKNIIKAYHRTISCPWLKENNKKRKSRTYVIFTETEMLYTRTALGLCIQMTWQKPRHRGALRQKPKNLPALSILSFHQKADDFLVNLRQLSLAAEKTTT